jgi:hypothetical protein
MKEKSPFSFYTSFFAAIVGMIIVNSVTVWGPWTHGVILESWKDILWAANISFGSQIAGSAILAFYRPARLFSFIQMLEAVASLYSVYIFLMVFPLDFTQVVGTWMNIVMKGFLVIGIAGSIIAILIHLVRTIIGTHYQSAQASKA